MDDRLEAILAAPPEIHRVETELTPGADARELPPKMKDALHRNEMRNYGLNSDVARFLFDVAQHGEPTLETGCGISTLVFAMKASRHTSITADSGEVERLRHFAQQHGVGLESVRFVTQPSEVALPKLDAIELSLVLIDGKHAFPWPIVDWFFTADRLRKGGLLLLDDAQMRSVAVLVDFLKAERGRWRRLRTIGRTEVFEKTCDSALDVAWLMQPWTKTDRLPGRIRRVLRSH